MKNCFCAEDFEGTGSVSLFLIFIPIIKVCMVNENVLELRAS